MFTVGMGAVANSAFALTTMAIAIPTGVKIFNWLGTLWGGSIRFTTAMLFACGFISMFLIGGLSGVMHSAAPHNAQQHDTYFVIAHFHYVLIGGALFAIFAGMYYWFPKVVGRLMDEKLGKWNFWLTFIGFNVTFFPHHFLGLMGMPRRIYTYDANLGWDLWNFVSTVGAFILAVGILLLLINLFKSLRNGEVADSDPWDARTLEWTMPSPPPAYNFAALPIVHSRDEFWAQKHEGVEAEVDPADAEEAASHGIHMPEPSIYPVLLALVLTVAAYGLMYAPIFTVIGLTLAVLSIIGWAYEGGGSIMMRPKGLER